MIQMMLPMIPRGILDHQKSSKYDITVRHWDHVLFWFPKVVCCYFWAGQQQGLSKNSGTPKSSILIGFSIINHPFWGKHPYFWFNTQPQKKPESHILSATAASPSENPMGSLSPHDLARLWPFYGVKNSPVETPVARLVGLVYSRIYPPEV